jgi:hypothetical protein
MKNIQTMSFVYKISIIQSLFVVCVNKHYANLFANITGSKDFWLEVLEVKRKLCGTLMRASFLFL